MHFRDWLNISTAEVRSRDFKNDSRRSQVPVGSPARSSPRRDEGYVRKHRDRDIYYRDEDLRNGCCYIILIEFNIFYSWINR